MTLERGSVLSSEAGSSIADSSVVSAHIGPKKKVASNLPEVDMAQEGVESVENADSDEAVKGQQRSR